MQLREPTNHLTGVAETLMITLYARAIETQFPFVPLALFKNSGRIVRL